MDLRERQSVDAQSPNSQLLVLGFMVGAHKRAGELKTQDEPIDPKTILGVDALLEHDWKRAVALIGKKEQVKWGHGAMLFFSAGV